MLDAVASLSHIAMGPSHSLICQQAKAATEKVDSDDPPPDGRIRFKKPTKRSAS